MANSTMIATTILQDMNAANSSVIGASMLHEFKETMSSGINAWRSSGDKSVVRNALYKVKAMVPTDQPIIDQKTGQDLTVEFTGIVDMMLADLDKRDNPPGDDWDTRPSNGGGSGPMPTPPQTPTPRSYEMSVPVPQSGRGGLSPGEQRKRQQVPQFSAADRAAINRRLSEKRTYNSALDGIYDNE
jgi:hypothetical protein